MHQLASLEESLGVSFQDLDLLRLALVHSSYLNENPDEFSDSNERLEFLGDALIGLVIAHQLYQSFPDYAEGELTALRSALVRGETLAGTANSLDLGRYLLMGRGEEANGGRDRPSNLASSFEALVGALYLDQGYEPVQTFVLRVMSQELSDIGRQKLPKSSKSLLQEIVQGRGAASPAYRIVEVVGKRQAPRFTVEVTVSGRVMGRGTGQRKSQAEEKAAQEALKALGQEK